MPGQPVRSNRQAKADEEARIAAETMRRRLEQQNAIGAATKRVEDAIASVREKRKKCERLASHLAGFYEEVDKLAKGKALLEATDLIVEHANNIVRESKGLIQGDPYLDQIKEFVPAGNNPVYPDVLWVARAVQQAVERYGAELRSEEELLEPKLLLGKTILAALRFFTEREGRVATRQSIATIIDNPPSEWFHGSYGSEEFNFTRLDNRDIVAYLSEGIAPLPDEQQ
jgi:hypothetical protein